MFSLEIQKVANWFSINYHADQVKGRFSRKVINWHLSKSAIPKLGFTGESSGRLKQCQYPGPIPRDSDLSVVFCGHHSISLFFQNFRIYKNVANRSHLPLTQSPLLLLCALLWCLCHNGDTSTGALLVTPLHALSDFIIFCTHALLGPGSHSRYIAFLLSALHVMRSVNVSQSFPVFYILKLMVSRDQIF